MPTNEDTYAPPITPTIPSIDPDTVGRGSYNIDGANVVKSIGRDEVETYSGHTTIPTLDKS